MPGIRPDREMKTVNKIMVAVDFSDYSLPAARYAVDLANDISAGILLVNVLNQRDVDKMNEVQSRVSEFSAEKYVEVQLNERRKRLEEMAKEIQIDNLDIDVNVRIGVPYKAILREIEEKKPDLLIMGAKGRSNLVDMIIGSCAQKLFRRCSIPLLSLREKQIEK